MADVPAHLKGGPEVDRTIYVITVDHPLQSKDDVTRWCLALRGQPKYGVCNAVGDLMSLHA